MSGKINFRGCLSYDLTILLRIGQFGARFMYIRFFNLTCISIFTPFSRRRRLKRLASARRKRSARERRNRGSRRNRGRSGKKRNRSVG